MSLTVRELTCREVADFLAGYLAGALGAQARSLFDRHLAECPDCVAYVRSYAKTMRLTNEAYGDDVVSAEVPERLVRVILAALDRTD